MMREDGDRPAIVRISALASAIASNPPSPTVRNAPLPATVSRGRRAFRPISRP